MIGRAIAKDVALLLRDRGALISLFALPVVFMLTFGTMFRFGVDAGHERPVALWAPPGDPRGAAITRALDDAPGFAPQPRTSADDVRRAVAHDQVQVGLVVPADARTPVELVIDLAAPVQVRAPLEGAVEAIVRHALVPEPPRPPVVEARSPPGLARPLAGISSFQVSVPGNAVLFGFFIALTVSMSFAGERRSGTWRRLLAAPVRRSTVLAATLVPYLVIGLCQLVFLFGIGHFAFGMQIAGSPLALLAVMIANSTCAVTLGLLFAALGGSERQLGGVGSVVLLVMGLLGGCMVPKLTMPAIMQRISLGVPHGWALDGYYSVLVRSGTGIGDVLPSVAALLGFAAVFGAIGMALFRFER